MAKIKLEKQAVKHLKERLRRFCQVVRIESNTGNGIPDMAILVRGRTLWLEAKCIPRTPLIRFEQHLWHKAAHDQQVVSFVVNYQMDTVNLYLGYSPNDEILKTGVKLSSLVYSVPVHILPGDIFLNKMLSLQKI